MPQANRGIGMFMEKDRQGLPGKIEPGRLGRMAGQATEEDKARLRERISSIEDRERSAEAALRDIQLH